MIQKSDHQDIVITGKTTNRNPVKNFFRWIIRFFSRLFKSGNSTRSINIRRSKQQSTAPFQLSKPTEDELVDRWEELHPLTAYGIGEFRRYRDGIWELVPKDQIERELLDLLIKSKVEGIRPNSSILNSLVNFVRIRSTVANNKWDANPNIITLKSRTLDLETRELRDHDPNDYVTFALPFDFDVFATAPNFLQVLSRLDSNVVSFLQEFTGLCLTTDTHFEMAIWLYGPPGSGKSSFLLGIETMLGAKVGHLGLQDIERSRFALTNLPGKNVIVSTEQPGGKVTVMEVLKQIISGEPIVVDKNYKDPVEVYPKAKIIWAMNGLPEINSPGDGLFRRIKVVVFPDLDVSLRDPKLKEKIKNEGPGILNWGLEGYYRYKLRGYIETPDLVKKESDEFELMNDIFAQFLEECFDRDPKSWVSGEALYQKYNEHCLRNGYPPFGSNKAAVQWRRLGLKKSKINGIARWSGIKPKNNLKLLN